MKLSVIIPAKNEERNIAHTVQSTYHYLHQHSIEHEIIVVVNGSTDKTAHVLKELEAHVPTLKLLNRPDLHGKGIAVKEGMAHAHGDFRLFMDADNSTTIDNVHTMLPYFEKGYGVVVASIALKGATVASGSEPAWRRLFGKMGNLYIQILAVPGIHDTQRGFKIFSAVAAHDIFPKLKITGWGFDVEALALARKFHHKIKEVPIHWKNDPNSHVGLNAYIQVLKETLKVRWNLMSGVYK